MRINQVKLLFLQTLQNFALSNSEELSLQYQKDGE